MHDSSDECCILIWRSYYNIFGALLHDTDWHVIVLYAQTYPHPKISPTSAKLDATLGEVIGGTAGTAASTAGSYHQAIIASDQAKRQAEIQKKKDARNAWHKQVDKNQATASAIDSLGMWKTQRGQSVYNAAVWTHIFEAVADVATVYNDASFWPGPVQSPWRTRVY